MLEAGWWLFYLWTGSSEGGREGGGLRREMVEADRGG